MMLPLALTLLLTQSPGPEVTLRRFALIAGANDGGASRVTLRYATSDAHAMAKVLTQLGGVDARDIALVENPTPARLSQSLEELAQRLHAAKDQGARLEVFFYYSGHSDEEGLLLKGERLSYQALRARLDALPAVVRIAVIDSCASGAMTLLKGGSARPSFLVDSASSLSGHAFLTSASADEAAQESERLRASIFTHFFLSGLRGAADVSRDGRVTLAEAYQYAFTETLVRTTSTRAGPQRPGWDIQLVGTGDLVLTDLRASDAKLVLDAELGGRVNVLGAGGGLVVEVAKTKGKPVELGLEAGDYRVVVDDQQGRVAEARLTLAPQSTQALAPGNLKTTSLEETVRRGDEPGRPWLPVEVAFVPPLSISGGFNTPPRVNFGLGVVGARVGQVDGVLVSSVFSWVDGDVTGASVGGVLAKNDRLTGVGIAGALLVATGEVKGLTIAPVMVTGADFTGINAGAVSYVHGAFTGAQLGMVNVTGGPVRGVQGGLANVAAGGFGGIQASLANYGHGESTGGQVGLLNIGGDVTGAQIGLLNIARSVKGLQLGLLNIAQESSAPIGLLSVITRGRFHLAAWANETTVVNVAAKLGSEHVYSFLVGGVNPRGAGGRVNLTAGLGLGVRHRIGRWYGELEGSAETLHLVGQWNGSTLNAGGRFNLGFQLFDAVALFAGPQVYVLYSFDDRQDVKTLSPWGFDLSSRTRLVPGVVLGAQFF